MVLICNDLSISLFHFFFWYGVELPLIFELTGALRQGARLSEGSGSAARRTANGPSPHPKRDGSTRCWRQGRFQFLSQRGALFLGK